MRPEDDGTDAPRDERREDWKVRQGGPSGKLVALGIAAVAVLVFILQNTDKANIDFLFWDGDFPLWIVIAVVAALGFVGGWSLAWLRARRRRRAERPEDRD